MSTENTEEKGWKAFKERLKNTYRLVVMNDESFEEVGSYKLSLLNLYIAISAAVVAVALFVILLIVFTPIKRFIPGYGDASQGELQQYENRIVEIQEKANANTQRYEAALRRLQDNPETEEDVKGLNVKVLDTDTLQKVNRIKEDDILRKEVEEDEQLEQRKMVKAINVSPSDVPLEQLYFMPPITGVVSEPFLAEKKHFGTDILAPKNTPVKAAMDGYVISSDWTLETGNTIAIQHSNSLITFYKHNSALLKNIGNFVKAGEAIAIIGNTGTLSDGPHLHFELWHKGKPVDPADYITFE